MKKDSFCSCCGQPYQAILVYSNIYPRACSFCPGVSYANPLPVAVLLVPVKLDRGFGILTVRRSIEPKIGELALPGGYLEVGETWQEGAVRELWEETGIVSDAKSLGLWRLETAPSNSNLLIFCQTPFVTMDQVNAFRVNSEVSELVVIESPTDLAFPTHSDVVNNFFRYPVTF